MVGRCDTDGLCPKEGRGQRQRGCVSEDQRVACFIVPRVYTGSHDK